MAVDRNLKRKKKREEKQKAKRQDAERARLIEKADDYDWYARDAYRRKHWQEALNWALKKLKLTPNDTLMRDLATDCAAFLNDEATLLTLLRQGFERNELTTKNEYFTLGAVAFNFKNYKLAQRVFEVLVNESSDLKGRLTKTQLKDVQRVLAYSKAMNAASRKNEQKPLPEKHAAPAPPSTKSVAPPAIPAETAETPKAIGQPVAPPQAVASRVQPEEQPELKVVFTTDDKPVAEAIQAHHRSDPVTLDLALKAYRLSFRTSYDQLICLSTLHNVQSLWYQEETARKVMKNFRGRTILADEVGLGKTVEAGLILKEYMMRGLVRSALVLVPSSLVHQWREELENKFGIPFVTTNDILFKQDPDRFWEEPFILASIQTAKTRRHFDAVTKRSYDIVIVDEAHHLKNRTTLNWKLVNAIQKTFLLMLTATPVQNSLEELFNLVTLLKPGHLKTQKAFKEEFITRGNPTDPRNREKLRQLLKEVMVRNTRSITQLHLPPRFALTVRVAPTEAEAAFYEAISEFVTRHGKKAEDADPKESAHEDSKLSKLSLRKLLEAAGSSHVAALRMIERISQRKETGEVAIQAAEIAAMGARIDMGGKTRKVVELLKASPDQKIIFVNTIATLDHLHRVLQEQRIPHVVFQGGMTPPQKQAAIDEFRGGRQVLLATGTGGEGHNLQFCHMMINYDLPWNPMEIEQRIGRIHRIGQEKDVQVYNFCAAGSLEDHILDVLDRKINMFELVVGEIDMILGRLQGEEEFSDLVYEIWVRHPEEAERKKAFDALAARLKRARSAYEKSKELDEKLFQEDFGV
jgi:SNF2 family DNA or RNA helicase